MQKTGDKFRYNLLKGVWKLFSLIPLPVMYGFSAVVFCFLYYLGRYRRRITRKNLTESFPEKSLPEIVAIEKRFYCFFVDVMFEMCKMASFSKREMLKHMTFTNIEEVNKELEDGYSVSLFVGHSGNWEWLSAMPLVLPGSVVGGQVYHRLHSRLFDSLLLHNRSRWGAYCIEMGETFRWIHGHVNRGQVTLTGYIADQAPRRGDKQHQVRFLNHCTPSLTGAEKITKKYGFVPYYVDVECKRKGYYEARFVRMCEQAQAVPDFELTDKYFELLEQTIRRSPERYLWTHNRFKHATTRLLTELEIKEQSK